MQFTRAHLIAGTATALILASPVFAQPVQAAQVYTQQALPMNIALKQFANAARLQIMFSDREVQGTYAPALNGRYTVEEALDRLLTGSGLAHKTVRGKVVIIQRAATPIKVSSREGRPVARMVKAEPAGADAESASASPGVEEIVVTAQKRAENLQKTPLAISAVTAETIEARAITSTANLGSIAPSLVVAPATQASNNVGLFIRGLGSSDPLLTSDSPVGLYVDGVILARTAGSAFEIADLERVEVLRGPQGTLYGRNTIGGAVNLITRKPGDTFSVRQKLSVGNFDFFQSRTVVDTGELGDSGLRASFTYLHKQRDGVVDNTNEPDKRDPGASRTDGARAVVTFDRGTGLRATYAYDYNRNVSYSFAFQLTAVRPDLAAFFAGSPAAGGGALVVSPTRLDRVSLDENGRTKDIVQGHTLTLEADLGDNLTLRSLTGYRKWRQSVTGSTFQGTSGLLGTIRGQGNTLYPVSLYRAWGERRQHQWSQEINLIGKVADKIDYVIGGYYFQEKGYEDSPQIVDFVTAQGVVRSNPQLVYGTKSSTKALFTQATWHVNDKLGLTGGIRYTWDKKWLDQLAPVVRSPVVDFSKFNWAATLDYKFSNNVMGYARVATGYKAGGFSARSFDSGFKPENLTSYEIGLKTDLLDRRLRINATAYLADHKDVQVNSFQATPNGASAVVTNAGKARYKGVELEVNTVPVRGLTAYATFGYVDRKFKKFEIYNTSANSLGYPVGQIVDIADIAHFSYSASTTLNAGAQYEFPAFDFGKLAARLDYNYRSKVWYTPNPLSAPFADQIVSPGRGLLDARITLSDIAVGPGKASVSVWGKNITDKKYRAAGIDFGTLGFGGNVYGDPATWGVDLNLQF